MTKYLLAADGDMEMYIFLGIIGLGLFLALSYYFTRWIFSIKRQLWNQKQIINLLIKLNRKNGMPDDELDTIEQKNNSNSNSDL